MHKPTHRDTAQNGKNVGAPQPRCSFNSSMDRLGFTEPQSQAQNPWAGMFQNLKFCRLYKAFMAQLTYIT